MRTKLRWSGGVLGGVCAVGLLACGSSGANSGSDGTAGSAGSEGSDGGVAVGRPSGGPTGGGSGGGASSDCLRVADLDEVLAPAKLSGGSVIYRMTLEGEDLYYASLDTLYRVSVVGGEPEMLWHEELTTSVPFFVRADDVLIVSNDKVLSVPKTGGAATELATLVDAPSGAFDGRVDVLLEGNTLYFKTVDGGLGSDPAVVSFRALELDDGSTRVLATGAVGENSAMVKGGDALWVADRDPDLAPPDEGDYGPSPDVLYRVPLAGGDIELVRPAFEGGLALSFGPTGADDSALFISAIGVPPEGSTQNTVGQSGIYRVPLDGGPATQLIEALVLFNATQEHDLRGDESFLRVVATTDDVYSTKVGSSVAEKRFCIADGEAHSMAIGPNEAYVALFDDTTESSSIVKIDL